MNIAIIFAGGTGQRMNSRSKPKQFLNLHGKPILIYTLEYFEFHKEIDAICVVCVEGWENELESELARYGIKKVRWITDGGSTGHDSIYKGLCAIKNDCNDDDIVLIHDGVRPLINEELISENIAAVKKYGNAITVENAIETVVRRGEDNGIDEVPSRDIMGVAKAPQSFYFKDIMEAHERAVADNFKSIDACHLMNEYGYKLHTVKSTPYNIKITSPSDFYVFRALYEANENYQIFGL